MSTTKHLRSSASTIIVSESDIFLALIREIKLVTFFPSVVSSIFYKTRAVTFSRGTRYYTRSIRVCPGGVLLFSKLGFKLVSLQRSVQDKNHVYLRTEMQSRKTADRPSYRAQRAPSISQVITTTGHDAVSRLVARNAA